LYKAARTLPAEILHVMKPHPMNSIAARAIRGKPLRKVLLDCDDQETASRFSGRWQRSGVAFFENHTPEWVDHITYHNSELEKFLLNRGIARTKMSYLPNGADLERMQIPDENQVSRLRSELGLDNCRVIAFVGSLSLTSHPINLLFEAVSLSQRAYPTLHLLLVGGGDDYEYLQQLARQMDISGQITFTGRIPHQETPLYYRLAEVVVDPVYDNQAGRTRLPIKLFESWALEVPFLTGDVGDRRLVLGDPPAGALVPAGSAQSLADGIMQLLDNKDLARQFCIRGVERRAIYDWRVLAQEMESIYQRLLSGQAINSNSRPAHD
jgi:glycosyltransferase involved in cell wall biosynthesis